jgi:FkbM family methyltransferase
MTKRNDDIDQAPENPDEMWAKKEFGLLLHRLQGLPPAARARMQGRFAQQLVAETLSVETPHGPLSFVMLGQLTGGRGVTLLTKQPGTIEWIDAFRPDSVFWDVGANIGVYSLYAGLRGDLKVVAFEPAAVNYFVLSANCEVNGLEQQVDCLLVGLGSERAIARLEVSQFDPGRSFSFHKRPGLHGRGRQAAIILPMDRLVEEYELPCPNYIKIDTPGMAEAILAGGTRTLLRPDVREVHLEVRDGTRGGSRVEQLLTSSGFTVAGRHTHGGTADVTFVKAGA